MTIYRGVDFHARQQTVCFCDTEGGVACLKELRHDRDDVRGFYSQFTGEVLVGLEASGYSSRFVELLESLGHWVLIGDAAEIRRRARRGCVAAIAFPVIIPPATQPSLVGHILVNQNMSASKWRHFEPTIILLCVRCGTAAINYLTAMLKR